MRKQNKRILWICESYPSGLTGTSVKTRETLNYLLQQKMFIDVCCIRHEFEQKVLLDHSNIRIFCVNRNSKEHLLARVNKKISVISSLQPVHTKDFFEKKLQVLIKILRDSFNYTVIVFDGYSTLQYCEKSNQVSIYVDDEDFTDLYFQRFVLEKEVLKKCYYYIEYLRSRLFEKKFLPLVTQIWAISPRTQSRLKTLSSAKSYVMPTIVPVEKNCFVSKSTNLVFTGTLNWPENSAGLLWFLENHWRKIHEEFPNTKLFVVGQMASEGLQREIRQFPNITICGFVNSLHEIYKKAAVALAPILINAGIKVKILNYLSYGLPVVAVKQATWGLQSTEGIVVSKEEDFATTVIELLKDQKKRKRLSKAAIENIRANHSNKRLHKFLKQINVL